MLLLDFFIISNLNLFTEEYSELLVSGFITCTYLYSLFVYRHCLLFKSDGPLSLYLICSTFATFKCVNCDACVE